MLEPRCNDGGLDLGADARRHLMRSRTAVMQAYVALGVEASQPAMSARTRHTHRLGDVSHGLTLFTHPLHQQPATWNVKVVDFVVAERAVNQRSHALTTVASGLPPRRRHSADRRDRDSRGVADGCPTSSAARRIHRGARLGCRLARGAAGGDGQRRDKPWMPPHADMDATGEAEVPGPRRSSTTSTPDRAIRIARLAQPCAAPGSRWVSAPMESWRSGIPADVVYGWIFERCPLAKCTSTSSTYRSRNSTQHLLRVTRSSSTSDVDRHGLAAMDGFRPVRSSNENPSRDRVRRRQLPPRTRRRSKHIDAAGRDVAVAGRGRGIYVTEPWEAPEWRAQWRAGATVGPVTWCQTTPGIARVRVRERRIPRQRYVGVVREVSKLWASQLS